MAVLQWASMADLPLYSPLHAFLLQLKKKKEATILIFPHFVILHFFPLVYKNLSTSESLLSLLLTPLLCTFCQLADQQGLWQPRDVILKYSASERS